MKMQEIAQSDTSIQMEIVTNFIQAKISFARIMTEIVQEFGLTPLSSITLNLIANQENPTVSSVFKALDLNQGNVSSMCKKLESDGFIIRQLNKKDERSVVLLITEQGRDALNGIEQMLRAHFCNNTAVSSKELQKAAAGIETLKKIAHSIEEQLCKKEEGMQKCLN